MGVGHSQKQLYKQAFAPRLDEGHGEATGPATTHWVIGGIAADQPLIQSVNRPSSLTAEIIGPVGSSDACGDYIHAHREGWKFLDEVRAAEDDRQHDEQGDLDPSVVLATEYATRAIVVTCVGVMSAVGGEACCLEGVRLSIPKPDSAAAETTAMPQAMREQEHKRDPLWHDVPESADEVEQEAMGVYAKT
eukprot:5429050-Prymnesium_polylepis.1